MPAKKSSPLNTEAPYPALAKSLERHAEAEKDSITALERLQKLDDPFVALIATLVLADERHHHALLTKLAKTVKPLSYLIERAQASAVLLPEEVAGEAERQVADLADDEARGVVFLRQLSHEHLQSEDQSAKALIDWMVLDSEKHERMLKMLDGYLKRAVVKAREERLHGRARIDQENSFA